MCATATKSYGRIMMLNVQFIRQEINAEGFIGLKNIVYSPKNVTKQKIPQLSYNCGIMKKHYYQKKRCVRDSNP